MIAAIWPNSPSRPAMVALATGLAGLAVLAAGSAFAPIAVAQGWLAAFLLWSGIPIGSLVLILIHRLTGGRWGDAVAPVLLPAASVTPLVAFAFLPVVLGLAAIYPWATPSADLPPDVGYFYLNATSFIIRACVALGGWSLLSILVLQGRCTKLAAGFGLAFHGLAVTFTAIDWILSIDPSFTSTAFPASIAVQQILAALAWGAIFLPKTAEDAATGDIGAFLIAAMLGVVYLGLMSYIVVWYGDLPEKAAWYLRRSTDGWSWVITIALLVGAGIPILVLLRHSLRRNRIALRAVGLMVLTGIGLHVAWLVAPVFNPGWLVAAVFGLTAMAGISLGLTNDAMHRRPGSIAHGE